MSGFIATITNGGARVEWSANDPASALRSALNCAKHRVGFNGEQLERLTASQALDLCTAILHSSCSRYAVTPPGGYTFAIERETKK